MSWVWIRDTDRTARKPHWCLLCGESIHAGGRYVERFGYDEGRCITMRMHHECEAETRKWSEMEWECFSPGGIQRPTLGTNSQS